MKYLLLAGNYEQARFYAKQHNLDQWVYVSNVDMLRGLRGSKCKVIELGTFYRKDNGYEFHRIIESDELVYERVY